MVPDFHSGSAAVKKKKNKRQKKLQPTQKATLVEDLWKCSEFC